MNVLLPLESRVVPMKGNGDSNLMICDSFLARPDVLLPDLSTTVVDLATTVRERYGLKTPDALQAACWPQLGPAHKLAASDRGYLHVPGLQASLLG